MANGRPGDSRTHDIVHHGIEVFGPVCDGLVREIAARLPLARIGELHAIVEAWPFHPDGRAAELPELRRRLEALRATLGRVPSVLPGADMPRPAAPPPPPRPARGLRVALAVVLGFVLGGIGTALAVGVLGIAYGELAGVSQFEGAYAMGVAAAMPLLGFCGGVAIAAWLGLRAWRR